MENKSFSRRSTIHAHKRQFAWQILIPLILVVMIIFVAGGLVITDAVSGSGQTRVWADISVIWLIVPTLFFALAILVILVTTIYGMAKLLQTIPPYSGKIQGIFRQFSSAMRSVADRTVKPLILIRQAESILLRIFKV
jgi:hypothetical protein